MYFDPASAMNFDPAAMYPADYRRQTGSRPPAQPEEAISPAARRDYQDLAQRYGSLAPPATPARIAELETELQRVGNPGKRLGELLRLGV